MAERAGAAANKSIVLIISTTAAFILPFLVASVNIALPKMGQEFHMEAVVMSWVSTAYFLAVAVFQVPVGRLSDIFGRRRFFLIGLVISTIASFLGAFAPATAVLIVSRVLQGIGAGMSFNNSVAILTSVFPPEERAKALGISQAGTYLGLSLGPLIGGVMTEHFGWRSLFFLSACLGVFLVGLVFIGLRAEWRQAAGEKFDSLGAVVYVFAIALFMYGFSSLPGAIGAIFFVLGILGLVFFGYWESRQPSPIFELSLFQRNRTFLLSNLAALITYISTFAVNFLLSLYLQYIKAFSAQSAGMVLVVASVLMTVFTVASGFISQKLPPRLVATSGMALNCVALALLACLGEGTSLWYVILALALYGAGIGLFVSPNTNIIMSSVAGRLLGVASGTLGTMRTAGMMLSMGIVMILFSVYIGGAEITPAYFPEFLVSVRTGFIIFTILGTGGLIAQLVAGGAGRGLT